MLEHQGKTPLWVSSATSAALVRGPSTKTASTSYARLIRWASAGASSGVARRTEMAMLTPDRLPGPSDHLPAAGICTSLESVAR